MTDELEQDVIKPLRRLAAPTDYDSGYEPVSQHVEDGVVTIILRNGGSVICPEWAMRELTKPQPEAEAIDISGIEVEYQ